MAACQVSAIAVRSIPASSVRVASSDASPQLRRCTVAMPQDSAGSASRTESACGSPEPLVVVVMGSDASRNLSVTQVTEKGTRSFAVRNSMMEDKKSVAT